MNAMENETSYCRFCAEPKSSEKLLNLLGEVAAQDDVLAKLNFLNAIFTNVYTCDFLPQTVCFVCYDSLNKAYDSLNGACEFLENVKRAQVVLAGIFANEQKKCVPVESADSNIANVGSIEGQSSKVKSPINVEVHNVKREISEAPSYVEIEIHVKKEISDNDTKASCKSQIEKDVSTLNKADSSKATSNFSSFEDNDSDNFEKEINNWSEYPWICDICSSGFDNVNMLRSHVKVAHEKCCAHYCVDCEASIKDNFDVFIRHVRKHRRKLRKICYYCNKEYDNITELNSHMKRHLQKPNERCPHCGELLKTKQMLTTHIQKYNKGTPKKPKKVSAKRPPNTPIKISIEELTCKQCKKIFKNPYSLKIHEESQHLVERKKDYVCDQCGKTFYNKGGLKTHMMSVTHTKIRPHICEICKKSFLMAAALRNHVLTHSGEKPYCCEQCGRKFRLKTQLNNHKIVHTDSMPYSCQYCNKKFRHIGTMKNHIRLHTGDKPYSCQNCGMEFTNWSNYNKHMKRRHNMDTAKKKITPQGVLPINPKTGEVMELAESPNIEEWKAKVMSPRKRGERYQEYEIVG